jgi:CRISPR-associated protein (TIGR02584 family)
MEQKNKKILLCVTGLSPQIVTETLYALAVKPQDTDSWIPDEIQVITTQEGADRVRLTLLHKKTGWFNRLVKEYNLRGIHFDESTILILKDRNNQPMSDIRTPDDNALAADFITNTVFNLTKDSRNDLHVSMAGGRKTMGFYVGYALSLYGRRQDQLSHVLVTQPFESHPEFYYPTKHSHVIYQFNNNSKPIDTKDAKVTLANIPFVRMHESRNQQLIEGDITYSKAVEQTQQEISNLQLEIKTGQKEVWAHGQLIKMPPSELAYYWWLAHKRLAGEHGIHWSDDNLTQQFLKFYNRLVSENSGHFEMASDALKGGMTKEYFDSKKAKINRLINKALGERIAQPYLISKLQPIKGSRYSRFGISLEPEQIKIL